MREIGVWNDLPVGCFMILRRDVSPLAPLITIHRVSRRAALGTAVSLATANGVKAGYEVRALDSECDCLGRAQLEDEGEIAYPVGQANGR